MWWWSWRAFSWLSEIVSNKHALDKTQKECVLVSILGAHLHTNNAISQHQPRVRPPPPRSGPDTGGAHLPVVPEFGGPSPLHLSTRMADLHVC